MEPMNQGRRKRNYLHSISDKRLQVSSYSALFRGFSGYIHVVHPALTILVPHKTLLNQVFEDQARVVFRSVQDGIQSNLRMLRGLIRIVDAGEALDLSEARFCIHSLRI